MRVLSSKSIQFGPLLVFFLFFQVVRVYSGISLPKGSRRLTPAVQAVAAALPAVVNISTERIVVQRYGNQDQYDPFSDFFDEFFSRSTRYRRVEVPNSLGSGIVVDSGGLIITNDHVIQKASRIYVTLADGTKYDAVPVAHDRLNDIALLRLESVPKNTSFVAIRFAIPGDMLLGETVIAVGNPFGLGQSVTEGVLSATGRQFSHGDEVLFKDILQTDAAINPGNSGGPLINMDGELIGINLAMRRGAQNIGFAIPVERVEGVLSHWLIPSRFGLSSCGLIPGTRKEANRRVQVIVQQILPDTPAAAAPIAQGDVILEMNGTPVHQALDAGRILWRLKDGDVLNLKLGDGRKVKIPVEKIPLLSGKELIRKKLQVELQALTPRLSAALGLPYARGVVVADVKKGSILFRRGVRRGDLIIQANDVPISGMNDISRLLQTTHHGDVLELVIDRIESFNGYSQLNRYRVDVPL